jgi:hypothetical protein
VVGSPYRYIVFVWEVFDFDSAEEEIVFKPDVRPEATMHILMIYT